MTMVVRLRRKLLVVGLFDRGKHVGGAPAGEEAGDNVRRQRIAGAGEFIRGDFSCNQFTINENAIAIKDDHRASPFGHKSGALHVFAM